MLRGVRGAAPHQFAACRTGRLTGLLTGAVVGAVGLALLPGAPALAADPVATQQVPVLFMLDSPDHGSSRGLRHLIAQPPPSGAHALAQRRAQLRDLRPPASSRETVERYAAAHGLTVQSSTPWQVLASGPAAATAALLGTAVDPVHASLNGHTGTFVRPRSTPVVPSALRSAVSRIIGLDNRPVFRSHILTGVDGPTLRDAYGAPSAGSGAGTTVATVQFSDWHLSDLTHYASAAGIKLASGQIKQVQVGAGPADGKDAAEVALDTEAILATAPRARQRVYLAENNIASAAAVYQQIAQDVAAGLVQVVSTSWGACEEAMATAPGVIDQMNVALEQMISGGATVFAASGDDGSAGCAAYGIDTDAVDYPASDPSVIAVGGTSLEHDADGNWSESGWEGSGGGRSKLFDNPSYQPAGARTVPDIASDADPHTGFAVYTGGHWVTIGGTSLAAPTQAGLLAGALTTTGRTAGAGDLHQLLYASPLSFRDVRSGSNGSFAARRGYDLVTGLGTPQWTTLLAYLQASPVKPGRPAKATATAGFRDATVRWTRATNAAQYLVTSSPGGIAVTAPATATSARVTGLRPGARYRFTVRAVNTTGTSSAAVTGYVVPSRAVIAGTGTDRAVWARTSSAGWHSLGGRTVGAPSVVTYRHRVYYLREAGDHNVWVRTDTQGWHRFGPAGTVCHGIAAAVDSRGYLNVGCRGGNNALYAARVRLGAGLPHTARWSRLGGILRTAPAVAPVGGAITFFGTGTNGYTYSRTRSTGWVRHPWRCINASTAFRMPGSRYTYWACQGTNHALWYATSSGGAWSRARSLGGVLIGRPAIASGGMFVVEGRDHRVWARTRAAGWHSYGGVVSGGVAAGGD